MRSPSESRLLNSDLLPRLLPLYVAVFLGAAASAGDIPVTVDTSMLADKGQVVVEADLGGLSPLGQGTLEASLMPAKGDSTVRQKNICPVIAKPRLSLSMIGLQEGEYRVVVTARDEKAIEVAKSGEVQFAWKGSSSSFSKTSGMKVLNNLVMELLRRENVQIEKSYEIAFVTPYEGWVFFSCTVNGTASDQIAVTVDDAEILVRDGQEGKPGEGMRYLSQGDHKIKIACGGNLMVEKLIVRAIPELIYTQFNEQPSITEYGPYDWHYLQKHIVRNVNVMTTLERALKPSSASNDITQIYREYMQWWQDQGKKWMFTFGLPGSGGDEAAATERIYKGLHDYVGRYQTFADGIIVDEFPGAGNDLKINYLAIAKAIDKLYQDPKLVNKRFYAYAYGTPMVLEETSKRFAETVFKHNGNIVLEWYPPENNTAAFSVYRDDMRTWEKQLPGATRHLFANIAYSSHGAITTQNVNPSLDYKVYMDMFMNTLANDPAFFGLGGVSWYSAHAAEEEYIRWGSRLFRHYCIEGKTNLLSDELGYKYHLTHVVNPDFVQGLDGWEIAKAEDDAVSVKSLEGVGYLEGRYIDRSNADGDTFVRLKRSAKAPNTLSQNIVNLTPGRLYSVKLFSGDYQNLMKGESQYEKYGLLIQIDNADILDKKSFQQVFSPNFDRAGLKKYFPQFNSYSPFWLNLHQMIFRAKGSQVRLNISDWLGGKEPGGPIGQELIFNFVEVQPYYDEN